MVLKPTTNRSNPYQKLPKLPANLKIAKSVIIAIAKKTKAKTSLAVSGFRSQKDSQKAL